MARRQRRGAPGRMPAPALLALVVSSLCLAWAEQAEREVRADGTVRGSGGAASHASAVFTVSGAGSSNLNGVYTNVAPSTFARAGGDGIIFKMSMGEGEAPFWAMGTSPDDLHYGARTAPGTLLYELKGLGYGIGEIKCE